MSDAAWRCLFTSATTWDELQAVIDEDVRARLILFLTQLLDDPDFSDQLARAAVGQAAPLIRAETRRVFEQGWRDLQLDALATSGSVQ